MRGCAGLTWQRRQRNYQAERERDQESTRSLPFSPPARPLSPLFFALLSPPSSRSRCRASREVENGSDGGAKGKRVTPETFESSPLDLGSFFFASFFQPRRERKKRKRGKMQDTRRAAAAPVPISIPTPLLRIETTKMPPLTKGRGSAFRAIRPAAGWKKDGRRERATGGRGASSPIAATGLGKSFFRLFFLGFSSSLRFSLTSLLDNNNNNH